jgi:transposase
MFIRKKKSPKTPHRVSIQIVESIRRADKVSQTILRHVGIGETEDEIDKLTALARTIMARIEEERQPSLPLFSPEDMVGFKGQRKKDDSPIIVDLNVLREEQRFNEGIVDVCGALYDQLGFNEIFTGTHAKNNNSILKSCVLARMANPSSKLRTSELLENDFAVKLPVEKIYRMMTQLEKISDRVSSKVKASTLDLIDQKVDILLYDVTTLYFESFSPDELRNFGFSKDCKFKETQLVLALITTPEGLPVSYKVFPGNTQEAKTLIPTIKALKNEFSIENIDFAADRGMFSEANLKALEEEKLSYVVAAKLKNMPKNLKQDILKIKDDNDENEFRVRESSYKNRRLVVVYSPARAAKDKKDRARLVERIEKIADKNGQVELKKLVKNSGTKKYLRFENENKKSATIDREKIQQEESWDGIFGYITNSEAPAEKIIERYKSLWVIEESFRINKTDLKIRPIFHHKGHRIKAHLEICFLAYALARQLMYCYQVQNGESVSFRVIRNELLAVQASLLVNLRNKEKYIIPSKATPVAKRLYRLVGLKRSLVPYKI